jgi:hypothetical protein
MEGRDVCYMFIIHGCDGQTSIYLPSYLAVFEGRRKPVIDGNKYRLLAQLLVA